MLSHPTTVDDNFFWGGKGLASSSNKGHRRAEERDTGKGIFFIVRDGIGMSRSPE